MKIVCLDAGHGISTPGKRSFDDSLREYDFNRDVTSRIKNHLERHGVNVLLTAPNDVDISLKDRCNIANKNKADIFVSIHANAFGSTWNDAHGWETFIYKGSNESKRLAQAIRAESIPFLGLTDRGIKDNPLYVVSNTSMPAVLIEHGFYTNKAECELLKTVAFREKCAIADAKGILAYLGIAWKVETNAKEKKPHWAEKHLYNLVKKGLIDSPEAHKNSLDEPLTKGQVFALLDRITDK